MANHEWDVTEAEFRGWTKAKVEGIELGMGLLRKDIGLLRSDVKGLLWRVGGLAAGVTAVITVVLRYAF